MADLSITASQVLPPATGGRYETLLAGAAITAGQLCYKDGTSAKLVDNDAAASASIRGVALNDAASGQKITLQTGGTVTIGAAASVAQGVIYGSSSTAGGIAPSADFASADYVSILGVGNASDGIALDINNSGIAVA